VRAGLIANTILATASDPAGTPPSKSATAYLNASQLAATGFDLFWFVGASGALLSLGAAVLTLSLARRRRTS
jgi:hypothetical protein